MSKWKKITAIAVAALVAGGAGGYFIGDNNEPILVQDQTVLDENAELQLEIVGLNGELEIAEGKLNDFAEVIEEAIAEDVAEEVAIQYLYDKDYKMQDWLNEELGYNIEDDDDLSFSNFEDIEVDVIDYEDGDYDVTYDVKVKGFDNGDEDDDFKEYVKVTVEIRDGEADNIEFNSI